MGPLHNNPISIKVSQIASSAKTVISSAVRKLKGAPSSASLPKTRAALFSSIRSSLAPNTSTSVGHMVMKGKQQKMMSNFNKNIVPLLENKELLKAKLVYPHRMLVRDLNDELNRCIKSQPGDTERIQVNFAAKKVELEDKFKADIEYVNHQIDHHLKKILKEDVNDLKEMVYRLKLIGVDKRTPAENEFLSICEAAVEVKELEKGGKDRFPEVFNQLKELWKEQGKKQDVGEDYVVVNKTEKPLDEAKRLKEIGLAKILHHADHKLIDLEVKKFEVAKENNPNLEISSGESNFIEAAKAHSEHLQARGAENVYKAIDAIGVGILVGGMILSAPAVLASAIVILTLGTPAYLIKTTFFPKREVPKENQPNDSVY